MKDDTKTALLNYLNYGISPGAFLEAVLSNDLTSAFYLADEENANSMREIMRFLQDELPWGCWGTSAKVTNWMQNGGLKVQEELEEMKL